jgi:hypothetical protein
MRLLIFMVAAHGLAQNSGRLKLTFEERARFESRTGVAFGSEPDLENPLVRTRLGAHFRATRWLEFGVMAQDSRAPFYGRPAPPALRDPLDLQEAYVEFLPGSKQGWGASVGRRMFGYGEQRLIGVPQWGNTARTFDSARLYYRFSKVRLEALLVSATPVRTDAFNRPFLSDRVWGTYNLLGPVDLYALRHDFPGGGTSTFGGRAVSPIGKGFSISLEGAVQRGELGSLDHHAYAWFTSLSRTVALRWPVTLSIEYKYASGSADPARSSETFDQMYPASHDKFGHADLFGWRNIHNLRSLNNVVIGKLVVNLMYNNLWLASPRDAIYNGAGRPILRSPDGTAGRHVGQEADVFVTYPVAGFQLGAGFAHFFAGEFIRATTPGVNPRYVYFFQTYSF